MVVWINNISKVKRLPKKQPKNLEIRGQVKCSHVWIIGFSERENRENRGNKIIKTSTFIHMYIHTSRLYPRTEGNIWVYILKASISSQNNGFKKETYTKVQAHYHILKYPGEKNSYEILDKISRSHTYTKLWESEDWFLKSTT